MYVRLLFVLLAALNLGAAGWLLFAGAAPRVSRPATDPGIPELQLVAARPGSGVTTDAAATARPPATVPLAPRAAPTSTLASRGSAPGRPVAAATQGAENALTGHPATVASTSSQPPAAVSAGPGSAGTVAEAEACISIGPFATAADARAALQALAPHVARTRSRAGAADGPRGYWVYLPPAASRERAQAEARELAAKGVKDYYVMGGGDAPNAISLGVYNDPVNAQNRVDQVVALGFGAKMRPRAGTGSVYWVDFAAARGSAVPWRQWVGDRDDVTAKSIGCF